MPQLTFTTREARRSGLEPEYTVWFETDQGRVAIEMTDGGLLMLHGLVSQVVTTMKTGGDEQTSVPGECSQERQRGDEREVKKV